MNIPDIPVFLAVALPLWEEATGRKPRLPAGRGLSLQQAMVAAGAEALELRASLAQNHTAKFADGIDSGGGTVTATDMLRGDRVEVRAQQVFLDFAEVHGEPLEVEADSTGCATGETREGATCRAFLECFERDAMALWWYGGLQREALPLDLVDQEHPRLGWWLQRRTRKTTLIDLTIDTGVPVVAAFSSEADGSHVAIGTAARFNEKDAAVAAVTEMVQMETSMRLAAAADDPELAVWIRGANAHHMIQFKSLPPRPIRARQHHNLESAVRQLAYNDMRAFAVELTLPGDPLPTMRVLVPGLCAMGGRIDAKRFERIVGRRPELTEGAILEPY